jgi:hypothetical protein
MKARRILLFSTLGLLAMAVAGDVSFAQGQTQPPRSGEYRITIVGVIDHMDELGGYFVRGEKPGGEFMIVNQNPNALKPLMKSKKTVSLEGILRGGEYLTIEKIDGKLYAEKATLK